MISKALEGPERPRHGVLIKSVTRVPDVSKARLVVPTHTELREDQRDPQPLGIELSLRYGPLVVVTTFTEPFHWVLTWCFAYFRVHRAAIRMLIQSTLTRHGIEADFVQDTTHEW